MRISLFCRIQLLRPQPPTLRRTFSASPTRSDSESTLKTEQPQLLPQPPRSSTPPNDPPQPPAPPPPKRTANPLIYPSAPSPHHTDLPTFLAYAARTGLDPGSTVYVGSHFEYTVAGALGRYGLSLRRVGGASDCGIDLLGTWALPAAAPELRVLAQCKAVQRPGPHLVRELEGAFVGAPAGWRGASGVVGLLVTERPATKGIREALARSRWPMGFVACSRDGAVGQFLWNRRAEEEGLEGVGVGMRHGGEGGKELVLTWRGRNLPSVGMNQGEG